MPLSEVSTGHIARNGGAETGRGEKSKPRISNVGSSPEFLHNSPAVQSMLKNTTPQRLPPMPTPVSKGFQPVQRRPGGVYPHQDHLYPGHNPMHPPLYHTYRQRYHPHGRPYHYRNSPIKRPGSPLVYSSRISRPMYRPSSPALSEHYRQIGHGQSSRSRTSPPWMRYEGRGSSPSLYPGFSHSDPLLRRRPSTPFNRQNGVRTTPPSPLREEMARPTHSLASSPMYYMRGSQRDQSTDDLWMETGTSLPSPVFYDYSEAFEEEGHLYRIQTPAPSFVQSTGGQDLPFVHHELDSKTDTKQLAELPAQQKIPSVTPMEHATLLESSSPIKAICKAFRRTDRSEEETAKKSTKVISLSDVSPRSMGPDRPATSSASIYSSHSSAKDVKAPPSRRSSNEAPRISESKPRLPSVDFSRLNLLRESQSGPPLEDECVTTLVDDGQPWGKQEICAPIARRSLSSPQSKEGFSRILSMDPSLIEKTSLRYSSRHRDSREETIEDLDKQLGDSRRNFSLPMRSTSKDHKHRSMRSIQAPPPVPVKDNLQGHSIMGSMVCSPKQKTMNWPQDIDSASDGSHYQAYGSPKGHTVVHRRTMKDLPALPINRYTAPLPPPMSLEQKALPCSFVNLTEVEENGLPLSGLKAAVDADNGNENENVVRYESPAPKFKLKMNAASPSTTSSPGSRPWNLDASYPWAEHPPELSVTMPTDPDSPQRRMSILPRFRLKIHRLSQSSTDSRLRKPPPLLPSSLRKASFGTSPYPELVGDPQGPSLDIDVEPRKRFASPVKTRFHEAFDAPSANSPTINLVPPSPGINVEARSFFSDDSSQVPPRNSLRQRFSQIRDAIASRTGSTDEARGVDRGLLRSRLSRSRTSERSSRKSEKKVGQSSSLKNVGRKMAVRVKTWWRRAGDTVRSWTSKTTAANASANSRSPFSRNSTSP